MLISPLTKSKQPVSSLWNKKMSLRPILASLIFVAGASLPSSAKILLENMVIVPAGFYEPFFLARTPDNKVPSADRKILVPAFMMDVTPVTTTSISIMLEIIRSGKNRVLKRYFQTRIT